MEGLENERMTPPPRGARDPLGSGGEQDDGPAGDATGRLRESLQAAMAELTRSAQRSLRHERLLASCATELHSAAHLLAAFPEQELRDQTSRRLRSLADDLEGSLRDEVAAGQGAVRLVPDPRPRLLLADDDADTREALAAALDQAGEVVTAADGQEALELAAAQRPDVILLDLEMPRLDGFEALERLRADPATAEIPVILVSGQGDDAAKVRGLDLGAIDFMQKPFSERELRARVERTLRLLRSQSALRELARTDTLTGLPNLRAFRARLEDEVKRSRRYRTPLACVMVDVDQLKPINDLLGHAAGDRAIGAVAAVLREELRETDFAARYGGDEFVVLLPHTTAEEGRVFAERVCARLKATELLLDGRRLTVAASFGVACRAPDATADATADGLVRAADAALYQAKHAGRGRVALGGPAPVTP
jgi:two-component system, cell cycle response regulator